MSGINTTGPQERLHGLDHVRGLAAVAVVALHSCYAYAFHPLPGLVWPVPLDEPSSAADAAFWWIEGCVMPLFFALSGYFLAQSLARQSPMTVLKGRTRRLLLPMATVGFIVLTLDLHVWVLGLIDTGRATISDYRRLKFAPEIQADLFGPAHLWYVEYLWLLCACICGIAWLRSVIGQRETETLRLSVPSSTKRSVVLRSTGLAALAVLAALLLSFRPQIVLGFQHGWLPDASKLAHAAIFIAAGMLLWSRDGGILNSVRRLTPLYLVVAVAAFVLVLPHIHNTMQEGRAGAGSPTLGVLLALFAFSATLAQLGAGLSWLNASRPALSRLAAASFWIYLVHHPLVGLLQVLVRPMPFAAAAKASIVFGATISVCLLSYAYIVERGAIARLLDGEWPWKAFRGLPEDVQPLPAPPAKRKAA